MRAQSGKRVVWWLAAGATTLLGCSSQEPPRECSNCTSSSSGSSTSGGSGSSTSGGTSSGGSTSGGGTSTTCTLADQISRNEIPPITFDQYHSLAQMESYFGSIATNLPFIAEYHVLGQSVQGRDVFYLVINATCQQKPPAFLGIGAHHGDEQDTAEAVLASADYLLRKSATDPAVKTLLQQYAFYLLPVMNPDGFALNTRYNANGIDVNRDYSYPERADADSFQQLETQLVKSLQESVGFRSAVAYHSGATELLWPWCYTGEVTSDDAFFIAAGEQTSQAMDFTIYQQSYDDYPTQGEYIDYAYWKTHTLAATFEISDDKTPQATSLAAVVDTTWKGTVAWLQMVNSKNGGSAQEPLVAKGRRKRFPLQAPVKDGEKLE